MILCRHRTGSGHGEREEPEKRDDPLGHYQYTFYLRVLPY
jgi:hypothetical protein